MLQLPSPIQELHHPLFVEAGLRFYIKREDLIHPDWGGNKYRKLKYNVVEAQRLGKTSLVTFGGAYSNHIHAVAGMGEHLRMQTHGFIRGEERLPLNPTLAYARVKGMKLRYLSRTTYRLKSEPGFLEELFATYNLTNAYLIPEGGTNKLALRGCAEIVDEILIQLGIQNVVLALPAGTGGTAAGLRSHPANIPIRVYSALKGSFLKRDIEQWAVGLSRRDFYFLSDDRFGGYARHDEALLGFIRRFYQTFSIALDPIYTGKMLFNLWLEIEKGSFSPGTTIVALHTGGLQGNAGFEQRHKLSLFPA